MDRAPQQTKERIEIEQPQSKPSTLMSDHAKPLNPTTVNVERVKETEHGAPALMPPGAVPGKNGGWLTPRRFEPGNPGNPNGGIAVQGWLHRMTELDRPELEKIADNPRTKSDKAIAAVQVLQARERGDLVEYEPWLSGEKSLTELKRCGVGTYGVKRAKVTERPDGTIVREIELHDRAGSAFDRFLDRTIGKAIQPSLVATVDLSPAHLAESVLADLRSLGMSPRLPLTLADVADDDLRREAERRWGGSPSPVERCVGGAGERDSGSPPLPADVLDAGVDYGRMGVVTVESHPRPDTQQANRSVSSLSVGFKCGVPTGERDSVALSGGYDAVGVGVVSDSGFGSHPRQGTNPTNTPVSPVSVMNGSGAPTAGRDSIVTVDVKVPVTVESHQNQGTDEANASISSLSMSGVPSSGPIQPTVTPQSHTFTQESHTVTGQDSSAVILLQHGKSQRIGSAAPEREASPARQDQVSTSSTGVESGAVAAAGDMAQEAGAESPRGASDKMSGYLSDPRGASRTAPCDTGRHDGGVGRRVDPDPQTQGEAYGASFRTDANRTGDSCGDSGFPKDAISVYGKPAQGHGEPYSTAEVGQEALRHDEGVAQKVYEGLSSEEEMTIDEWPPQEPAQQPYIPKPPPTPEELAAKKAKNNEYLRRYMRWQRAVKAAKKRGAPKPKKKEYGLGPGFDYTVRFEMGGSDE